MKKNQPETIFRRLKLLHERGVFSYLDETSGRDDKLVFRFQWLLKREFVLEVNANKSQLVMRDLLPMVEYRSFLDRDLRAWVSQKNNPKSSDHQDAESSKTEVSYANRKQSVSLFFTAHNNALSDGLSLLFTVVNELFIHLGMQHTDYLHQQLGVPEE